jgi:putative PIN family toxin of toxin-antitoxin system
MSEAARKAVYDCNIYVQALINMTGPAGGCVEAALAGRVSLFVSSFVLDEIRESYLKLPQKYGVTQEQTERLADGVASVATLVEQVPELFVYPRDPDDAHYVNLALVCAAKLVVSRDRDLLDLMDQTRPEGVDFSRRFPDLRVVDPLTFLRGIADDQTTDAT